MLNPKTNVGKLKNGVFTTAKLKKNTSKSVEKHVKDTKLVQINPKASSHDWGSSLTLIYAFKIKKYDKGVIRADNLSKILASYLVKVFSGLVHAYYLAQMCQE